MIEERENIYTPLYLDKSLSTPTFHVQKVGDLSCSVLEHLSPFYLICMFPILQDLFIAVGIFHNTFASVIHKDFLSLSSRWCTLFVQRIAKFTDGIWR